MPQKGVAASESERERERESERKKEHFLTNLAKPHWAILGNGL